MPRIRKKTSRRGTTRQRESIQHKVAEHRRKVKKQARKDKAAGTVVQKKSKKDPGIPNNFPYKDQILAEVAEQRRQAVAERQRRKEEKRAAAVNDGSNVEKSPVLEDMDVDEFGGQGFDGITSLKAAPTPKNKDDDVAVQERVPEIPISPGPRTLRQVVQKADVVLHVLDARDPAAGISDALVSATQGKLVILLNKADTVPRESLVQWLVHLRTSYTVLPFRVSSAFMPSGISFESPDKKARPMPKNDALGLGSLWKYLDGVARAHGNEELVVAVTGVTNAGKSAVINSIIGSQVLTVYDMHAAGSVRGPSTTVQAQEVVATIPGNGAQRVRLIDTPGLQFVRTTSLTDEERVATRARDILLRCRGRVDRLKDPLFGVTHIVRHADTQDLMLAYNLPAFLPEDVTGFLAGLARVTGLIKKRGMLDHAGAARMVLRDWGTGKLMRYTMPRNETGDATEEDAAVLGAVRTKKEVRSEVGAKLIKMGAGVSDKRDVEWDLEWNEEESGSDEEEEEEEEEEAAVATEEADRQPVRRRVRFE